MKIFMCTVIVVIIAMFSSCDDGGFEPDYSGGQATAFLNDEEWIGQGRGTENNQGIGFDMSFDVHDNLGQDRQGLDLSKIPSKVGRYNLFNTSGQARDSISGCTFFTLSFDGDVIENVYRVVEGGGQSTIEVLSYDASSRLLSGEFSLKLSIDPDRGKANPSDPDTILFEMGEFEVLIEE